MLHQKRRARRRLTGGLAEVKRRADADWQKLLRREAELAEEQRLTFLEGEEAFQNVVAFIKDYLSKAALKWWEEKPETKPASKPETETEAQRMFVERAVKDFKVTAPEVAGLLGELPPDKRDDAFAVLAKLLDATMHLASAAGSEAMKLRHGTETGRKGGKASGEVRKKNRRWLSHAKDLAISIRSEQPSLSRQKLMSEIEFGWKSDVTTPGRDALEGYLKELEASGELPRADKNNVDG